MNERPGLRETLTTFAGNPANVGPLASALGFTPVPLPRDLLANRGTPLAQAFETRTGRVTDRFGVQELYRVADGPATGSALYLAVLSEWGFRSSSRDRARRRVAKAVVQNTADTRSLILLVPNNSERPTQPEVEFVLPRLRERAGSGEISTIRALVHTVDPSRFHLELLGELTARPGESLIALAARWRKAFSVERVTREFYQAYAGVRDRIVMALVAHNPSHPWVIQTGASEDGDARRREWATRQLGRVLFLWFLQSKRWLGYDGSGEGSPTYLLDLWGRRSETGDTFWTGLLQRLLFEAMAATRPAPAVTALVGSVPYLNGGLFRDSALEGEVIEAGGRLELPDEVFDPVIAEGAAHTVLSLLSRYRFTTRESTPDDQSVDPDPELLGRVFENLYQGDERHHSGTYYTPREIVHFMCRQALDGYLRDKADVDQGTIDWLRREVSDPADSDRVLDSDLRERIDDALDQVRICDPSVGSGAFLLGSMQEMVRIRKGMAHAAGEFETEIEERVEEWKRRAIEHSLYGVDINPEAVEICQLRLWLSLVLDYQGHPRNARPLPNLDFRIRVGDSLIDRFEEVAFVESLPAGSYQASFELVGKLDGEHEKIERWLAEYEHAMPSRQREIRDLIQKTKLRELRAQVTAQRDEAVSKVSAAPAQSAAARTRQARSAKKAEQSLAAYEEALGTLEDIATQNPRVEKPFLWPLAFPEAFESGGFDIVLANPPYVRQENISAADQAVFKQAFKAVFSGTADLLVFFYARAFHLLRSGGHLAFITSNGFVRRNYGQPLRQMLGADSRLLSVIDFGEMPIFDASVEPYVLIAQKMKAPLGHMVHAHNLYPLLSRTVGRSTSVERLREEIEYLDVLLDGEVCLIPQETFVDTGWRVEPDDVRRLFDRLRSSGTPLGEYGGQIHYGIKTGLNDAFVINREKRDELVAIDPHSANLIRPWLRGRDVKRWTPEWSGHYLIAILSSDDKDASNPWAKADSEQEARRIFRSTFPALHAHLSEWEEYPDAKRPGRLTGLRHRSDQGRYWWELRACAYYEAFGRPKVIWPEFARTVRFALDDTGAFANNKCFFLPDPPEWLMPLLNSSVVSFMIHQITNQIPGAFVQLYEHYMEQLPIIEPDARQRVTLRQLAERRHSPGDEPSAELDAVAAAVYGLSRDDVDTIARWFESRRLGASSSDSDHEDDPDE